MKPKATFAVGFTLALVILTAVGLLSYRRVIQQNEDQTWVVHTHLTIERLDAVENDFLAEALNLRTHLLVPEPAFLQA
jgi:CHASE3 domain sensor protein